MSNDTPSNVLVEEMPVETHIKTVSVKYSRRVDLGYLPYRAYLKSLNGKPAPYGSRDHSEAEFDVFMSAEVGTDVEPEQVLADLRDEVKAMVDNFLKEAFSGTFTQARQQDVPEEAFSVSKATVSRDAKEDF